MHTSLFRYPLVGAAAESQECIYLVAEAGVSVVRTLPTSKLPKTIAAGERVFVKPNVGAKRATTAWRAGQEAQNGPKAQRLMASATCRWRSA